MNWLYRTRSWTLEQWDALLAQGNVIGRSYGWFPILCGEGPMALPAVDITVFEERTGTVFHVITPLVIRGKFVECLADFYDIELERPVEPEECGAERGPIPRAKSRPNKPRP